MYNFRKKIKRNLILADYKMSNDWPFYTNLIKTSKLNWEIKYTKGSLRLPKWRRLLGYVLLPISLLYCYKNTNYIISWQQFYGIVLAVLLRFFKFRNQGRIIILTFIYKPKSGVIGKIFFNFIKYSISSNYIEKVVVFSKSEVKLYSDIFSIPTSKFEYIPLGIDSFDPPKLDVDLANEKYIFSTGFSNRDYEFLIETCNYLPYNLKIAHDNLSLQHNENITILKNTFQKEMQHLMYNSFCVVIPLKDSHISSGQLVVLQAMQMGKAIIITESDALNDYIINGYNGIVVKKDKNEFVNALQILYSNTELYERICFYSKLSFTNKHTMEIMSINISKLLI